MLPFLLHNSFLCDFQFIWLQTRDIHICTKFQIFIPYGSVFKKGILTHTK